MAENSVEDVLKSKPFIRRESLTELLGCSKRSLLRWQDQDSYINPMPRPFASGRGVGGGDSFDSSAVLKWYKTLPLRKKLAS